MSIGMIDQYFGTKELVQVVLKATQQMIIGKRILEEGEPLMYFNKVKLSAVNQEGKLIMARGGWGNPPLVMWQDRGPVTFQITEGVMTRTGLGILFGAEMLSGGDQVRLAQTEVVELDQNGVGQLKFQPRPNDHNFCYKYEFEVIQERIPFLLNYDKIDCGLDYAYKTVLMEYYYNYGGETLKYLIKRELFNNLSLRLEGKFHMKSENDGINRTNFIVMPKVQVSSNINLILGERVDPTTSVFRIVALPDSGSYNTDVIMEIMALDENIDRNIL